MKLAITTLLLSLLGSSLIAQTQTREESKSLFSGNLYSRVAVSYQSADDYHSGYNSFASAVFDDFDGEYTFYNYTLDVVYISRAGFYLGTGLYTSSAEVNTNGLGLGVPDTDSNVELREIPFAIGYETTYNPFRLRFEARYMFNVDDDFKDGSFADANILPVTDGSDSLTLSVKGKFDLAGFEHALTLGYQFYENDVSHPLFPSFSLGDRLILDYEISKVMGDLKLTLGHQFSQNRKTTGTPSSVTGTAYLTEKPRAYELRALATYRVTPRFLVDGGVKYTYAGKDVPKQETIYLGVAYIF
ncbi:MAG: hypothetical protein ACSHX8_11560 [Opitutaceae bacterium]